MWKRLIVTVVGVLLLGLWSSGVTAEEKKARAAQHNAWMEAFATKLGLDDKQKSELKSIHEKYQPQYEKLFNEEKDEVSKILTPEQREKAKEMLKEMRERRPGGGGGEKKPNPK